MSDSQLLSALDASFTAHADRIALVCPSFGELTYSNLDTHRLALAAMLRAEGVQDGDRVLVFCQRGAAAIVAMQAVLAAGAVYVPVTNGMPPERLTYIAEDSGAAAIICDESTAESTRTICDQINARYLQITVAGEFSITPDLQGAETRIEVEEDAACYLLYTSGSTGKPKGVVVTHANVADYATWGQNYFEVSSADRVLSTAPFYFDMSTFDIYVSLCSGARLVIASEKDCMFPKLLLNKIDEHQISLWKAVSSLFGHVSSVAKIDAKKLSSLRCLIFSGERLPTHYLVDWMTALPNVSYYNAYGPTEATGISSCFHIKDIPAVDADIPIGLACENTKIHLFDNDELIEEVGHPGELVISGIGIARGYWKDSEKTERCFVRNIGRHKFEGFAYKTGDIASYDRDRNLVFSGRVDRQIKHQGYRIELDDIESALESIDTVETAAVVLVTVGRRSELVAYFKLAENAGDAEVRAELKARLPQYMVPRILRPSDEIPLTDRGKKNYQLLQSQGL